MYSGVVDNESVRIALFLAEHNAFKVKATDVSNAYLHAKTRGKVYIVACPENALYSCKVQLNATGRAFT